MCILCVVQKWSRRVATMLPWLVIPLIGLWGVSQFLPPPFRFEITSPKIACVFVLLVTLFWYEILMPRLSAWRVRRNALLREKKRTEAIELQKLRKTATRRCRNCLTPYKDQNPGGGKFMCSYCGHVSKRPVLDLAPCMESSNSGFIRKLVGKGGKMLNGKAWSESGWFCNQDWFENGSIVSAKSTYPRKDEAGLFDGDENCLAQSSYPGLTLFACMSLKSFVSSLRWVWRKIFRINSSKEAESSDSEHRGMLGKRGDIGSNCHESKGEKARRKAEEKRQARLEKELEEEEERKQKEEVARLVEERRKLRDEKMKAELQIKVKESKAKEAERKRQDWRKDKERGSKTANCDAEEQASGKESEKKRDLEKNSELERHDSSKSKSDVTKSFDSGHVMKNTTSGLNRNSRYFDRVRGSILSSRALSGSGLFGRSVNSPPVAVKDNKFRRDVCPPEKQAAKVLAPARSESTQPKKSWQQLFTRSTSTSEASTSEASNVISKPNANTSQIPDAFDNPINFGLPSPFLVHPSNLGFSTYREPKIPSEIESEDSEQFEDAYVADPMSLLGPVSESLENFQKDCGVEISSINSIKPSPIESPSARLRDEKTNSFTLFPATFNPNDARRLSFEDGEANHGRTWHMWQSFPLGQEGLGNWHFPLSMKEDGENSSSKKTMASLFSNDDHNLRLRKIIVPPDTSDKRYSGRPPNEVIYGNPIGASSIDKAVEKAEVVSKPDVGSSPSDVSSFWSHNK